MIRKKFPLHIPRSGKELKCHLGTYTKKTYLKPSEQLVPNRRPLSYSILTKIWKESWQNEKSWATHPFKGERNIQQQYLLN